MKKLISTIAVFFLIGVSRSFSQVDPHFSQYYAYPLWLNPALTGVFNGGARLNANIKQQWSGVGGGYKTGGISGDFRPTEKVGLGLNIINQAAGTAGYNYFAAYGSFGYGIAISSDGNEKLHFGVQAGLINRSFDRSRLQLDNQYNPATGFDPSLPNFENFSTSNATIFDAGAGIFYYDANPENKTNLFGGVSVAHLNGANDPFATDGIKSALPLRFTVHGGVKITASEFFDITPHFVYVKQHENQIRALGVYSEFKFENDNGLILGGMFRVNDAAVVNIGYHLRNLVIAVSNDFNTSALSKATNGHGGFEMSLSYIFGETSKNSAEICPRF